MENRKFYYSSGDADFMKNVPVERRYRPLTVPTLSAPRGLGLTHKPGHRTWTNPTYNRSNKNA